MVNNQNATINAIYDELKELKLMLSRQGTLLAKSVNEANDLKFKKPAGTSYNSAASNSASRDSVNNSVSHKQRESKTQSDAQSQVAAAPNVPVGKPVESIPNESAIENCERLQDSNGESAFTTVQHRKRRRQPSVFGTKAKVDAAGLEGAEPRVWLYVGHTKPGTTCENVLDYLRINLKNNDVNCEKLNAKGQYPSFKISAPGDLKDTLHDPQFWPMGVIVRRFTFRNSFRLPQSAEEAT